MLSSKLPLLLKEEQNLMVLMGSDTYPERQTRPEFSLLTGNVVTVISKKNTSVLTIVIIILKLVSLDCCRFGVLKLESKTIKR